MQILFGSQKLRYDSGAFFEGERTNDERAQDRSRELNVISYQYLRAFVEMDGVDRSLIANTDSAWVEYGDEPTGIVARRAI